MPEELMAAIVAIPSLLVSGVVGLLFWFIKKYLDKSESARVQHEQDRKKFEQFLVKQLSANTRLTEAVAISLREGRCNGEITEALKRLDEAKYAQREWLQQQGIDSLFSNE